MLTQLRRGATPGVRAEQSSVTSSHVRKRLHRIEAEIDEFEVARVKLGQSVKINAEGFERA